MSPKPSGRGVTLELELPRSPGAERARAAAVRVEIVRVGRLPPVTKAPVVAVAPEAAFSGLEGPYDDEHYPSLKAYHVRSSLLGRLFADERFTAQLAHLQQPLHDHYAFVELVLGPEPGDCFIRVYPSVNPDGSPAGTRIESPWLRGALSADGLEGGEPSAVAALVASGA